MIRKLVSFIGVGSFATLVQYLILTLLVELLQWDAVLSSAIGFSLSALINYFLNYHLTFHSHLSHRKTMPKFFIVALTGLCWNSTLMVFCIGFMHYLFAQILTTGLVLFWNFFFNLLWSFRDSTTTGDASADANTQDGD